MRDLSHLGKVDASSIRYAERMNSIEGWYNSLNTKLWELVYAAVRGAHTKEKFNAKS